MKMTAQMEKFVYDIMEFRDIDCGECNDNCILRVKCEELGHTYCQALAMVVSHLYDVVEDNEIMEMVEERDKKDSGIRYSIDEIEKLINP